jgi:hypothetical protein|tara:strand:+ start:1748 stop:2065 length:318 start_codon:yes stop_codon:yes gene_type:complete
MRTFLTILAILVLGFFIYKNSFKIKEGVTFTNYDNYHTFNMKPWDNFCIPNSPSCENNPMYAPKTNGVTMPGAAEPGCHCKKTGHSTLTRSCTDIDYNPYVEYRR